MKKNILLLVCMVFLAMGRSFGATVTVQDAQTVALNFFKIKLGSTHTVVTATLQYTRTESDNTVDFYAFNMSPVKGFVIVSATDNDQPVIGYSLESAFPADFSKIGMSTLLTRWSEELHYVALHNVIATANAAPLWTAYRQGLVPASEKVTSVAPFCQTTWDQNTEYQTGPNLYNNYCPGGTGNNQAVTGCVATAMAQIMKYWSYPTKGLLSSSYDDATSQGYSENYGTLSCNYADSTFLWATMPLTLTNTSSTAQINAIGSIMRSAGVSVDMDYAPTGSGAFVMGGSPSAQYSYVHYFGYQNVIKAIGLSGTNATDATISVATAAFQDSIEAELNAGRLVQVQGTDPTNGGHTWVCDGYETSPSTMFHMNWGWSGYADAYFAVTNLDPNDGEQLTFSGDVGVLTHILPPANTGSLTELATAAVSAVCAGTATQLQATTHTGATYSWTPTTGLSSSTIANPVATPTTTTSYTVTADSAGVTATSTITITVQPVPTATIGTPTEPTCYGSANGSATVTVTGGTSAYTYHWSNGQTTATAGSLASGNYTLTVTDAHSCTATATKTVAQPTALSASASAVNATCGQANGSITTTISGGTNGYTYLWSNNETTATATSLASGTYHVTITDTHSCSTTASATISGSGTLSLVTNTTNVSCYGTATGSATATVSGSTGSVTYHWSNGATTSSIQNVDAATYNVTITDGSGCSATSSKAVSQPTAVNSVVSVVNTGCSGASNGSATATVTGGTGTYTYQWSTGATTAAISNVPAGTYSLSVSDANHCSVISSAVVAPGAPLSATVTSQNASCYDNNNGTGQITMSNGTAPYSYNWNNGASAAAVTGLAPGSYSVTITDANHCTASGSIAITQPTQILLTPASTMAIGSQDNGSATIAASGATAPYTYDWSNGSTAQSITNVAAGTYTVTVTDANNCSITATDVVGEKSATGIAAISNEIVFSIYPNPARTQVSVQVDQLNAPTTFNLNNILGQTIISQELSATQTQIDLSSLASGVYLVQLRQGDKTAVKQLIVTR